jgi:hypothetical protein
MNKNFRPRRTGEVAPEAESGTMKPLGYRAAIRLPNGQVFIGGTHEHAYQAAGQPHYDSGAEYGFADKGRNFITYDQADEIIAKAHGGGIGEVAPEGVQPGTTPATPASAEPGEREARGEPFSNLPDHALPKLSEIEHTKALAPGTHFLDPKGVRRKIPHG